jgi:hypothetical protein
VQYLGELGNSDHLDILCKLKLTLDVVEDMLVECG